MPLLFKFFHKIATFLLICAFLSISVCIPQAKAGEIVLTVMPVPGTMVQLSPAFTPAHLQGITIHPDNALQFDFLIQKGDGRLNEAQKKQEYTKLIKYFLASLTVPDKDQWVNLSPYEKERIVDKNFGRTEMGRDLLEQDYLLKQLTSSLMYPEKGLGKSFWDKVYALAWKEYHTTNIPVNTFNKVWIIPDEAVVYESGNTAYIIKSHLKIMLEEDYLALSHRRSSQLTAGSSKEKPKPATFDLRAASSLGSQLIRQIILPQIEREVNEGKNFAQLRQIVSGMILATWYKKALKQSLLGKIYSDKNKIAGIKLIPYPLSLTPSDIYNQYLQAFKKGVYNYIKEDTDKYTHQTVPRKYFAGGFERGPVTIINQLTSNLAMAAENSWSDAAQTIDQAMVDITPNRTAALEDAIMQYRTLLDQFLVQYRKNEIDSKLLSNLDVAATKLAQAAVSSGLRDWKTIHSEIFPKETIPVDEILRVDGAFKKAGGLSVQEATPETAVEVDLDNKVKQIKEDLGNTENFVKVRAVIRDFEDYLRKTNQLDNEELDTRGHLSWVLNEHLLPNFYFERDSSPRPSLWVHRVTRIDTYSNGTTNVELINLKSSSQYLTHNFKRSTVDSFGKGHSIVYTDIIKHIALQYAKVLESRVIFPTNVEGRFMELVRTLFRKAYMNRDQIEPSLYSYLVTSVLETQRQLIERAEKKEELSSENHISKSLAYALYVSPIEAIAVMMNYAFNAFEENNQSSLQFQNLLKLVRRNSSKKVIIDNNKGRDMKEEAEEIIDFFQNDLLKRPDPIAALKEMARAYYVALAHEEPGPEFKLVAAQKEESLPELPVKTKNISPKNRGRRDNTIPWEVVRHTGQAPSRLASQSASGPDVTGPATPRIVPLTSTQKEKVIKQLTSILRDPKEEINQLIEAGLDEEDYSDFLEIIAKKVIVSGVSSDQLMVLENSGRMIIEDLGREALERIGRDVSSFRQYALKILELFISKNTSLKDDQLTSIKFEIKRVLAQSHLGSEVHTLQLDDRTFNFQYFDATRNILIFTPSQKTWYSGITSAKVANSRSLGPLDAAMIFMSGKKKPEILSSATDSMFRDVVTIWNIKPEVKPILLELFQLLQKVYPKGEGPLSREQHDALVKIAEKLQLAGFFQGRSANELLQIGPFFTKDALGNFILQNPLAADAVTTDNGLQRVIDGARRAVEDLDGEFGISLATDLKEYFDTDLKKYLFTEAGGRMHDWINFFKERLKFKIRNLFFKSYGIPISENYKIRHLNDGGMSLKWEGMEIIKTDSKLRVVSQINPGDYVQALAQSIKRDFGLESEASGPSIAVQRITAQAHHAVELLWEDKDSKVIKHLLREFIDEAILKSKGDSTRFKQILSERIENWLFNNFGLTMDINLEVGKEEVNWEGIGIAIKRNDQYILDESYIWSFREKLAKEIERLFFGDTQIPDGGSAESYDQLSRYNISNNLGEIKGKQINGRDDYICKTFLSLTRNGERPWEVLREVLKKKNITNIKNLSGEAIVRLVKQAVALKASEPTTTGLLTAMIPGGARKNRYQRQMAQHRRRAFNRAQLSVSPGGINLNSANMDLQIKRDGRGVPLPLAQQDMAQLSRIQGFVPVILEIKPAANLPILSELKQSLQN